MSKPNLLLDHFDDLQFQDRRGRLLIAPFPPHRLALSLRGYPGDWNTVAGYIAGPRRVLSSMSFRSGYTNHTGRRTGRAPSGARCATKLGSSGTVSAGPHIWIRRSSGTPT